MKTDTILFVALVIAVLGVIFFGMQPKVCVDKTTGDARTTHRLWPCRSNEQAVIASGA